VIQEEYKGTEVFYARTRHAWRTWLSKNHTRKDKVFLIIHKQDSNIKSVRYDEAVEEALCFGWIDSTAYGRDDDSSYRYFAKRKPKSKWSKLNRTRVRQLTEAGLMTAAGQAMVNLAKKTGTWLALEKINVNSPPVDLISALKGNEFAYGNFLTFPPSSKRIILEWIENAKRPETRSARIQETVLMAGRNLRAHHVAKKGHDSKEKF
jgi:uncharacterized protein YdeI (YjbR/CyaY-like superfamily)